MLRLQHVNSSRESASTPISTTSRRSIYGSSVLKTARSITALSILHNLLSYANKEKSTQLYFQRMCAWWAHKYTRNPPWIVEYNPERLTNTAIPATTIPSLLTHQCYLATLPILKHYIFLPFQYAGWHSAIPWFTCHEHSNTYVLVS
jgi:hypothetical protein